MFTVFFCDVILLYWLESLPLRFIKNVAEMYINLVSLFFFNLKFVILSDFHAVKIQ